MNPSEEIDSGLPEINEIQPVEASNALIQEQRVDAGIIERGESAAADRVGRIAAHFVEAELIGDTTNTTFNLKDGSFVCLHRNLTTTNPESILVSFSEVNGKKGQRLLIDVKNPLNGSMLLDPPASDAEEDAKFQPAEIEAEKLSAMVMGALQAIREHIEMHGAPRAPTPKKPWE